MDTGTVYHFCDPTLMDGFATSPNMSFGTGPTLPSRGSPIGPIQTRTAPV